MSVIQKEKVRNRAQKMPALPERPVDNASLRDRVRERLSNLAFGWINSDAASRSLVLQRLNWLFPLSLFVLVVVYQVGPARWIHAQLGHRYHLLSEIIVYGTAGPLLAFMLLHLFRRWLEERDTSDLQSQLLERAREEAKQDRELNDDALQVLFAAGAMFDALKAAHPSLDETMLLEIETTEEALQTAVQRLRSRLLDGDGLPEVPRGADRASIGRREESSHSTGGI